MCGLVQKESGKTDANMDSSDTYVVNICNSQFEHLKAEPEQKFENDENTLNVPKSSDRYCIGCSKCQKDLIMCKDLDFERRNSRSAGLKIPLTLRREFSFFDWLCLFIINVAIIAVVSSIFIKYAQDMNFNFIKTVSSYFFFCLLGFVKVKHLQKKYCQRRSNLLDDINYRLVEN